MAGFRGRWLTSKEAAALLRVHPKHVYRLLRAGLPARRVGGQWRFDAAEIERWSRGHGLEQVESNGNKSPHDGAKQEPVALLLSWDDIAVHALVAEVNRRAPPAVGLVAPPDACPLAWLDQPGFVGATFFGDFTTPSPVQLAWLHIAHQQFGLVARASATVPEPASMLRRNVRVASWPPGSDLRSAVDAVLSRECIDARAAHCSALACLSHADILSAVVRGAADIGVTTAAWATRFGLPFHPLGSRPLGLVVAAHDLGHLALIRCWEVLQSLTFRDTLEGAGGYDTSSAGVLHYLRAERSAAAAVKAVAGERPRELSGGAPALGRTRWIIVVRDRGQDVSPTLLRVAARLHDEGVRVAGFVQVPRRTSSRVSGYDLQRLGSKTRLPLARRRAPGGAGPVLAYSSFQFQVESFARARAWLVRDARRAEVLVLDGISTREADGGGHFEALAWASRLSTPLLVVACVRRDRIAAVVDKLGLAGRVVDLLDTNEAVAGPAAIERAIVAAVRA